MKRTIITTILMGACFALVAFAIPTSVNAQTGQLRYQNRYSKTQVGQIITRLEKSSDTFKHDFNVELDHSPLNGTHTEDEYNGLVKRYENAMDKLRKEFNRNNSWWMIRNEVADVITNAQPINNIINGLTFRRKIERQWNNMRNDINTLADTFDLPGLNGGGWNGGPWTGGNTGGVWNGGQTSTPPSWAQGTFYGTAPNGSQITLTINRNGQVTANVGGGMSYGTYYRGYLILGGNRSTLRQIGNGLQTVSTTDGETINYSRSGWTDGGNWGGGQTSTPPSWAQGTFYGTAPNGTQITLTINVNGQVTANVGGGMSYGSYYRNYITIGGNRSEVRQISNGLQTVSTMNGETINYNRSGWGSGGVGGVGGDVPNWAVGSFRANNPQTGGTIIMTISGNGSVTVNMDGNMSYGTLNGTLLTMGGYTSRLSRRNDGFRTVSTTDGQVINYTRF